MYDLGGIFCYGHGLFEFHLFTYIPFFVSQEGWERYTGTTEYHHQLPLYSSYIFFSLITGQVNPDQGYPCTQAE